MQTMGHRLESDLQALPGFPHHTQSIFADTSDDSSVLGTDPHMKYLQILYRTRNQYLKYVRN